MAAQRYCRAARALQSTYREGCGRGLVELKNYRYMLAAKDQDGQLVNVMGFVVRDMARIVGQHPMRLREWEAKGIIPRPKFYTRKGWRLYTQDQMDLIADSVQSCICSKRATVEELARLKDLVWLRWRRIPGGVGDWRKGEQRNGGRCDGGIAA